MRSRRSRAAGLTGWHTGKIEELLDREDAPSPDDVLGEIGLFIVIVLGVVLAINVVLLALHVPA
jgi:hypothetical protein